MGLFDKLESKLEQGVNGAFARAFKSEVQPVEIASGIRRAMDDRAASVGRGKRPIVPNLFTVELSPTDYKRLAAWGDELDDELIASAQEHADEQRYTPGGPLTVVLEESQTLETGVFRLRPATAKAADALAERRAHPRPQQSSASDDHGFSDAGDERSSAPGRHTSHAAPSPAGSERARTTASGVERGFGFRVKEYLLGHEASHAADGRRPSDRALDAHEADYSDDSYDAHDAPHLDDARDGYDPYAEQTQRSNDAADAGGSLGGAYTWDRFDDEERHTGFDDAHPDNRFTSGTSRGSHAWDDDDDDYGDPTGFAPGLDEHADATSRYNPAGRQTPRPMSPRERPWLKIDGQRYPLLGAITVLGRDDEADIIIDDPGVSRGHSEIRITHDGPHLVMSVRDLGSTNGTYVNGELIDSTHVHDGDRLTLGRTSMTIHLGDRT